MIGRLIDAENITYTDVRVHEGGWCETIKMAYKWYIDAIPTIEAIPVEWIRNLQDKFYEKSEWLIVAAVGAIIEDWQKEQRKEE